MAKRTTRPLPKGYEARPDSYVTDHLPVTGGKGIAKTKAAKVGNGGAVARGIWRKPKINLNWLRRATIDCGSHSPDPYNFGKPDGHCVMEAFAIATGQRFTDFPICVSREISLTMQCINDTRKTDRERNKLKKVLPNIMGTAPLKVVKIDGKLWEEQDTSDPAYREVEGRRSKLIREFQKKHNLSLDDRGEFSEVSTKDCIKLVESLAALKPKASLKRKQTKPATLKSKV